MKKLENFCKALENLKDCENYSEPYSNVTKTGLVGLFQICFEQAWKAMKEILEDHGYDSAKTGSPKMVIKLAYSAGMISDEDGWLRALTARNNTAHSYNESVAVGIIRQTKKEFIFLFEDLRREIENRWL